MAALGVPRFPLNHSSMDRLRKSYSYEPLAAHHAKSSSSSGEEGIVADSYSNDRQNSRLHSLSMSHIKSNLCLEEELRTPNEDHSTSNISAYQMNSLADDDVFTEDASRESNSSMHVSNQGFDILRREGRELGKSSARPIPVDAQGIYPPSACVFVANLTQGEPDAALEAEVTRVFSEFGTVFVKIRRDQRNMPFGFCQFTDDEDAKDAVAHGHGTIILGRPCRVEKAKANSTFIVYKHSGMSIDEREAFKLLDPLGEISSVKSLDIEVQAEMGLPATMVVQFKLYDPRRDVRKATRSDQRFVVKEFEPNIPSPETRRQAEIRAEEMAEYDRDRRSAYLGNLPLNMAEPEIKKMATSSGRVQNLRLHHKIYKGGPVEICFAFVEFARPDSVDDIVTAYHGREIRGHIIKVERKQSRSFNENQGRDWKVSMDVPKSTQSPKFWRAPGSSSPTIAHITCSSTHRTSESPKRNSSYASFGSPADSSISRLATLPTRRSQGYEFTSPSRNSGLTAGIPSKAARTMYFPSFHGRGRFGVSTRPHVRDVFDSCSNLESCTSADKHAENRRITDPNPGETNSLSSRNTCLPGPITPSRRVTSKAGASSRGKDNIRDDMVDCEQKRVSLSSREALFKSKLADKQTIAELSSSANNSDNEEGGARFSPVSMPSAISSKASLDHPMKQAVPYYHYTHMSPYIQSMAHPLVPLTPFPYPHVTHREHIGTSHLPTPVLYPDFYGPFMFPPPPMSTTASYEPIYATPPQSTNDHVGSPSYGQNEMEETGEEGSQSPTRGNQSLFRPQLSNRRQNEEASDELKWSFQSKGDEVERF